MTSEKKKVVFLETLSFNLFEAYRTIFFYIYRIKTEATTIFYYTLRKKFLIKNFIISLKNKIHKKSKNILAAMFSQNFRFYISQFEDDNLSF